MTRIELERLYFLTDDLDNYREWKKRVKNTKDIKISLNEYVMYTNSEKIDVKSFLIKELDKKINLIEKKFKSFGVEV